MLKKFSLSIAVAFVLTSLITANAQDKEKYQQQAGSQPML